VIIGDLNVAPDERDICNPKANLQTAGFTIKERTAHNQMMNECQLIDIWRRDNPSPIASSGKEGTYTFWNTRSGARDRNAGWRIDLALVSAASAASVVSATIITAVKGSDHCPIGITFIF
jgi:exodeoxyribonuclease-3